MKFTNYFIYFKINIKKNVNLAKPTVNKIIKKKIKPKKLSHH